MNEKIRRAINFDLDTRNLNKYYTGKNIRNAYRDIEKFLIAHGFSHRQWSGYVSNDKLTDMQIIKTVTKMNMTFP